MRLSYSSAIEKPGNQLVNKIEEYTNSKVKLVKIWNARKIQSLFNHKDKMQHHSFVIYRGVCSCCADYIEIRWKKHSTGEDKNSDCVEHLNDDFNHEFRWFVLSRTSKNCLTWKILEVYYIKARQPSLNAQVNSNLLNLYRNGVT